MITSGPAMREVFDMPVPSIDNDPVYNRSVSGRTSMSLNASALNPDPYAPLARLASVVLVAVEKVRVREQLTDEERFSIPEIAGELALLSQAREIGSGAPIPTYLQKSFCTLVAIDVRTPPQTPLEFKEAGEDLAVISKAVGNDQYNDLSIEVLDRAQEVCYRLLLQLNERRPVTTWM